MINNSRQAEFSLNYIDAWRSVDWDAVQSFFRRLSVAVASIFVQAQRKQEDMFSFRRLTLVFAVFNTQKVIAYALAMVAIFPEFAVLLAVAMSGLVFFTLSLIMVFTGTFAFLLLAFSGFATSGVRSGIFLHPSHRRLSHHHLYQGSLASSVQSVHYGATIPRGSTFSVMQSVGARGGFIAVQLPSQTSMQVSFILAGIIRWVAGGAALCLFVDDVLRSFGIFVK